MRDDRYDWVRPGLYVDYIKPGALPEHASRGFVLGAVSRHAVKLSTGHVAYLWNLRRIPPLEQLAECAE